MADIYTVTEQVRAALGLPGDAAPDLDDMVALHVDDAIRATVRKCAASSSLRHHVLTDPAETTATLDSDGVADLSTLIESAPRILLEDLKHGDITHPDSTFPLRPLEHSAQGALSGALDAMFPRYWIRGTKLHTRATDVLSGDLSFAVPHWMTLEDFPDALVLKLVTSLVELLPLKPEKNGKERNK